jgi:hypothetical protein
VSHIVILKTGSHGIESLLLNIKNDMLHLLSPFCIPLGESLHLWPPSDTRKGKLNSMVCIIFS